MLNYDLRYICLLFMFVLLTFVISDADAESRVLTWDPPYDTSEVAGYRLRIGLSSGNYTSTIDVGSQITGTISNLERGRVYYVVVLAYTSTNRESDFSNEIRLDLTDNPDSDGDGLSDEEEAPFGTDPYLADTDGDGISDLQELLDGTDPLDTGSFKERLGTTVCSEWNSYLQMVNVAEYSELSNSPLTIESQLYSITGTAEGLIKFFLAPLGQLDVLVHALTGFVPDSYGKLCSTHDGAPGDIDGRMVYYKPDTADGSWSGNFQFAFAVPFSNGIRGNQFVGFNTFQPSLAAGDESNLVANWIQLTNLSDRVQRGTLTFYHFDGSVLASELLELPANARRDISAHRFGPSIVGLIAWRPQSVTAKFKMGNNRYLYRNPGHSAQFESAFQLQGLSGSGVELAAPLTTKGASAILELSNVSEQPILVDVEISNVAGTPLFTTVIELAAFSSYHLIADPILVGENGVAIVRANHRGSLLATAMQYERNANGGINNLYAVPFVEATGNVLKGSYNTFLGQDVELLLVNTADESQIVSVSMIRADGTIVLPEHGISIPANGLTVLPLNQFEQDDVYGVVRVTSYRSRSVVAWTTRKRGSEFVIPVPVR